MSDLPATMTAIEIVAPGGPEMLRPASRPVPVPGPEEVLIRVVAAGVNRPDVLQRRGHYPPPPGITDIPGLEIAGTIAAIGPGAGDWRVGDSCCALVAGGGYAEYCLAPAPQVLPVPDGLAVADAAALPETCFTVWANVFERGRLAPGEVLLVHGGSGGIGTTAIQMARAHGARVFATAGGAERCRACEALGAERAFDYRDADFVAGVRAATEGHGADVILDMVGGEYLARNIETLAEDGRLVQIAFLQGAKAAIDLRQVMTRRLTLTGSTLRARPVSEKGRLARSLAARVWPWLAAGSVRPRIHARLALDDAARAHQMMEEGRHFGKIILLP